MNTDATTYPYADTESQASSAFINAIVKGDNGILRAQLDGGCNPDLTDDAQRPALLLATRFGRVEAACLLLAAGAAVDAASRSWETPLYAAASAGHEQLFFLLLDAGADIHRHTKAQSILLHAAANGGSAAILARVLESLGDKLNARQRNGSTALIIALQRNHTEAVKLLLEAGANPFLRDAKRRELTEVARSAEARALLTYAMKAASAELPRKLARNETAASAEAMQVERARKKPELTLEQAVYANNEEAVRCALAAGESPNTEVDYMWTVLHCAAARGQSGIVRLLLEAGADANAVAWYEGDTTPLHLATFNGDVETVRALIEAGADLEAELWHYETRHEGDDGSETALEIAASRGHINVVRALLHAGANFRRRNSEGFIPLHRALLNRQTGIAMELAAMGPDVLDAAGLDGMTALIACVRHRDAEGMRLLLELGANPDAANATGNTALHEAIRSGYEQGIDILLSGGAAIDLANKQGETPLHLAVLRGDLATARALLLLGADTNARTLAGKTALDLATRPALRALLEHER